MLVTGGHAKIQHRVRAGDRVCGRRQQECRVLRNLGGFDLSPVILLIVLHGIDNYFLYPMSVPGYFQ